MVALALVWLSFWQILEMTGELVNAQSWVSSVELALDHMDVDPDGTLMVVLADTEEDVEVSSVSVTSPLEMNLNLRELQESNSRALLMVSVGAQILLEEPDQPGLRVDAILLVLGKDPQGELLTALQLLEGSSSWSPRLPHLVTTPTPGGGANPEEASALLLILWEHKVTRAVLLINVSSHPEILKWHPQGLGDDCNGPTSSSIARVRLTPSKNYISTTQVTSNPFKLYNFFAGCTLRASTWEFPPYTIKRSPDEPETVPFYKDGLDVRIAKEIAKRMKMKVDFGDRELLYIPTGEFVANGSADVTVGAFVLMPQFYPSMDPTMSYWSELAVWVVPGGAPVPRWLSIVVVFSLDMWLFLLVSYGLVVAVFALLGKVGRFKSLNALDVFRALLADSVRLPGEKLGSGLLLVWTVSDVVISSAYQSALVSFLTDPGMYDPITSEEELMESGLKIGLFGDYREIFETADDDNFKLFLKRSWDCEDAHSCLDRVAHFRDSAMPYDLSYIEYEYLGDGRHKIKIMGTLTTYSIMMFVTRGSPLLVPWNFYLFGLMEGSLVSHWWKQITSSSGPLGVNAVDRHADEPVIISLVHLQGVFLLWMTGIICSIVAFCAELGSRRFMLKKRRRFGSKTTLKFRSIPIYH